MKTGAFFGDKSSSGRVALIPALFLIEWPRDWLRPT